VYVIGGAVASVQKDEKNEQGGQNDIAYPREKRAKDIQIHCRGRAEYIGYQDGCSVYDEQKSHTPQIHPRPLNGTPNDLYIPFTGFQILIGHNQSLLSYCTLNYKELYGFCQYVRVKKLCGHEILDTVTK
jgi:hypothetical protein